MEADGGLNGFDYLGNWIQLVGDCQVEVVVQRYRDVALSGSAGGVGEEGEEDRCPEVRLQTSVLRRRACPPGLVG